MYIQLRDAGPMALALLLVACASRPAAVHVDYVAPADGAVSESQAPSEDVAPEVDEDGPTAPRFGTFGFDADGMDTAVDPGDDFYTYANGQWALQAEIPADRARFGVFDMLTLEAEVHVNQLILEAQESRGAPGSNAQLIGDLYSSWMDLDAIDAAGLAPAEPYLARIEALISHDEAAALMAETSFPAVYRVSIMPDPEDPTVYTVSSGQGGLGMPNREYYLDPSGRFVEYREAYHAYISTIFDLAGFDNADERATAVLAFETELAESHWTRERSRQITETYNVLDVAAFGALAPSLHLVDGLLIRGIEGVDSLIVAQPSAIEGAGATFEGAPIDVVKDYLRFHFISARASWLPTAFDEASFLFYSKTLAGTEEQRPRDRRGTVLVGQLLGHALGQEYVARHFPPSSKALMESLVDNLTRAFRGRLEGLAWMDDETRAEALEKLGTFEARIGYPEIWDEFDGLVITPDDYFGNRMRLSDHRWAEELARFPEPVDRRRWGWPPQIVNASYSPLMNQITFPAGILQAPFFDPAADPAMNYGAIGAVIGHEIGHGFDDQGRRFDAQGRIRDWWTEETNALFEAAADRLAEQYSAFCPIDDLCINGRLALGENIGDLGGMQMAYAAYRNYVAETYPGGEAPVIDGFTGDQRFFLSWAQVWRSLYRDDALRAQLVNGPHSPGMYRVNGVVRNLDAWYEAFDVNEDHELYLPPEERVRIW